MSGSITSLGWIDLGASPYATSGTGDWAIFQDSSGVATVLNGSNLLTYFDVTTIKWVDIAIPHQGTDFILPPVRIRSLQSTIDSLVVPNVFSTPYVYDFKKSRAYQPAFTNGANVASAFSIEFNQLAAMNRSVPLDLGIPGYCFFYCEQASGGAFFLGFHPFAEIGDIAFVSPEAPGGPPGYNVAFNRNYNRVFAPPGYLYWGNNVYTPQYAYIPSLILIEIESNYLYITNSSLLGPGTIVEYSSGGAVLFNYIGGVVSSFDNQTANGLAYYQSLASTGGMSPPMWQPPWIGSYDSRISQCVLYYYSQGFALPLLVPPPQPTGAISGELLLLGNPGMVFWLDGPTGHIFTLDFNIRQFALHNTINLSRNRGQ